MVRKEQLIGIVALLCLFIVLIITESFVSTPAPLGEYQEVHANDLELNPAYYEGKRITTLVSIASVTNMANSTYQLVETLEGPTLLYNSTLGALGINSTVLIRGVSYLESEGYIIVYEVMISDGSSSILRSIPGIIVFVIAFFFVFSFDFRKFAFISRSD